MVGCRRAERSDPRAQVSRPCHTEIRHRAGALLLVRATLSRGWAYRHAARGPASISGGQEEPEQAEMSYGLPGQAWSSPALTTLGSGSEARHTWLGDDRLRNVACRRNGKS